MVIYYNDYDVIGNNKPNEPTIKSALGNGLVLFAHTSDTHGDAIRYRNFMKIAKYLYCDFVVNTGDVVAVSPADGFSYLKTAIADYPRIAYIVLHRKSRCLLYGYRKL